MVCAAIVEWEWARGKGAAARGVGAARLCWAIRLCCRCVVFAAIVEWEWARGMGAARLCGAIRLWYRCVACAAIVEWEWLRRVARCGCNQHR